MINEFHKINITLKLLIEENPKLIIIDKPFFLYESKILDIPSFVINRTNNYFVAKQFESIGVRVFNNSTVSRIANNKYLSYLYVSNCHLPILNTLLYDKNNDILDLDFPIIVKSLDGKGGKDVYYCNDKNSYTKSISSINSNQFIVQKVASDLGKDLRVYILGNKIYKSIIRVSKNGFKSNYCLGNDAYIYDLNNEEIKIVDKILELCSFDYVGIDFLFNNGKIIFNEIEDSVGARMLYDKTDLNIAYDFVKYISDKL